MDALNAAVIETYLSRLFKKSVSVLELRAIGEAASGQSIKTYGYGKPVLIDYRVAGGDRSRAVLHTSSPSSFGHEHMADRAQSLLWSHKSFGRLSMHVRSLDVGAFRPDGSLMSLGDAEEFFLLTEFASGIGYESDLERIQKLDALKASDIARSDALCDYLVNIHSVSGGEAGLYTRRIRELVGHGECIMGLIDSYRPSPMFPASLLEEIEHLCVKWRWKLKGRLHRLRQVHGDFHPWNILFEDDSTTFTVLDRSRGEWGDPADDVASITANYLFFSLQRHSRLEGPLGDLFRRFWRRYLAGSQDQKLLEVVGPFFAFRGLVMASPIWYPKLKDEVRRKLLSFITAVLTHEKFDPAEVNSYFEG